MSMKVDPPFYRLHLFILRLWWEPLDHNEGEWRGEIKNPSTGEVRYVRNGRLLYDALLDLLEPPGAAGGDAGRAPDGGPLAG